MKICVNDMEVELLPGMTVRNALVSSGKLEELKEGKRVYDEWGNELGLDGALYEGIRITIR